MTRDQIIADLQLHGYVPYANPFGWVAIWSNDQDRGRMAKFFTTGDDAPGWDVRELISTLALNDYHEVPWHRIQPEELKQLTAKELPPKFRHGTAAIKEAMARMDLLGVDSLGADGNPV